MEWKSIAICCNYYYCSIVVVKVFVSVVCIAIKSVFKLWIWKCHDHFEGNKISNPQQTTAKNSYFFFNCN